MDLDCLEAGKTKPIKIMCFNEQNNYLIGVTGRHIV